MANPRPESRRRNGIGPAPLAGAALLAAVALAMTGGGPSRALAMASRARAAAAPETTPNWLKHAVIYEIFPDRFFDGNIQLNENPAVQKGVGTNAAGAPALVPIAFHQSWSSLPYDPNVILPAPGSAGYAAAKAIYGDGQWNLDFFGGNLPGITLKLDYLKSLGVNTLYLTPIFEADTNHKYDTGNFKLIDPGFGTLADFRALVKAATARGMHIILDGVFEDTGANSVYFNQFGTYHSVGAWQQHLNPKARSPYWSFYMKDPAYKNPFMTWNGVSTLILTSPTSPAWQRFVFGESDPKAPLDPAKNSVAAYWLHQGISGWRLDSADNANLSPAWWQAFRRAVKRLDPQAAIIGEIWASPVNDNGVDWLTNHTFDSVMNYQLQQALLGFFAGTYNAGNETFIGTDAQGLMQAITGMQKAEPAQSFYAMMNILDSQDTMRALTVLEGAPAPGLASALQEALWQPSAAQAQLGAERLSLLTDVQFTLPGAPTIWYGDEAGLGGYSDPLDRQTYPWGHVNLSVLNHYRELGAMRQSLPALATGTFSPLYAKGQVLAYLRQIRGGHDVFGQPAASGSVITVVNNQGRAATVAIPLAGHGLAGVVFRDLLTPGAPVLRAKGDLLTVRLAPWQGRLLAAGAGTAPVAWLTQPSQSGMVLTWQAPPGGSGIFTVHLSRPGWQESVSVHGTSLALTPYLGPAPLTATVSGAGGISTPVTVPALSLTAPVVTASYSAGVVGLSWPAVAGASAYRVYASTRLGGWRLLATTGATRWHGPSPYTGAVFRVAAQNAGDYEVSAPVATGHA